MERKGGGGIIQLSRETDRLKTFRGGICRRDPEILSPIKRDFRRILRRGADNKPQNWSCLLKFIYLIYSFFFFFFKKGK